MLLSGFCGAGGRAWLSTCSRFIYGYHCAVTDGAAHYAADGGYAGANTHWLVPTHQHQDARDHQDADRYRDADTFGYAFANTHTNSQRIAYQCDADTFGYAYGRNACHSNGHCVGHAYSADGHCVGHTPPTDRYRVGHECAADRHCDAGSADCYSIGHKSGAHQNIHASGNHCPVRQALPIVNDDSVIKQIPDLSEGQGREIFRRWIY